MASAGNPNHSGPFDMQKLFKTSTPPPSSPNPTNPNSSPFAPSYPPPPASYPPPTYAPYPPQTAPFLQQQQQYMPYPQDQLANMHLQRPPMAYPSPPLQSPPQNHNHGARLMALLGTNPPSNLESPAPTTIPMPSTALGTSEFSMPMNPSAFPAVPSAPPANLVIPPPAPSRLPSSKLPKGRRLIGDHVVYDVDIRLQGELQPQLEVTPISKYVSDPGLVLGRQIAVNRSYIRYGLKLGAIRVLKINTALRALLRGHTQGSEDSGECSSNNSEARKELWHPVECQFLNLLSHMKVTALQTVPKHALLLKGNKQTTQPLKK